MGGKPVRVLLGMGRDAANALCLNLQAEPEISVVGTVYDGYSVLDSVARAKPDVLLLDIILPEIDGIGVLERLSSAGSRPGVIVVSSVCLDRIVAQACACGADYYLLRPVQQSVLVERILQIGGAGRPTPPAAPQGAKATGRPAEVYQPADVCRLLHEIGVPAHLLGYRYLRRAIEMVTDKVDLLSSMTKELYPTIAREQGATPSRVERAIRHAIDVAWGRGDIACLRSIFGNTVHHERGKPTNSEFIAMLAERFRVKAS